jgi:hypothetical protein
MWRLTVLGLPCSALGLVAVRYSWQRWHGQKGHAEARSNAVGSMFLVVLLLYPRVSSSILAAFRCRQLGEHLAVLEVDYAVDCGSPRYLSYRAGAWAMLLAWPVGIPLGLLGLLWRQWRRNVRAFDARASSPTAADRESVADTDTTGYNHSQMFERFAFCINDYRPSCWWFEPFDMLRKLALSGLLQFFQRGTAAQVLLGCLLAFASFGLQVRLLPYREPEANLLKCCTESVLFMTFLISFILRVLPRVEMYEPFQSDDYGWLLVGTFLAVALLAVGLAVRQVWQHWRFRKQLLSHATADEGLAMGALTRGAASPPSERRRGDGPDESLLGGVARASTGSDEELW